MNKKALTNKVAEAAQITKKDANLVIGHVLEGIKAGLIEDGKVTLVGFGTFKVVQRAARKARNPQTGAPIDVPAKMVPKFKASKAMREMSLEYVAPEVPEADEVETTEAD
jgi:DNA-binding protein HU-beta